MSSRGFFTKRIKYDLTEKEIKDLKISFNVKNLYVEVVCTNWEETGNSRGGTMKNLIPEKIRTNPCEKPIREFVISYDGSVQLCCHSYQNKEIDNGITKVDKLDDDSIFKIYTNKVLTDSRKDLFSYRPNLYRKLTPEENLKDQFQVSHLLKKLHSFIDCDM